MFPDWTTSRGGKIALIATRANELKFFKPALVHERTFAAGNMGLFQLNEDYRYARKKSEWSIYGQGCCNPISLQAKYEIDLWLAEKKRPHLTIDELAKYVYKIKYVEEYEAVLSRFIENLEKEGVTSKELFETLRDGSLERAAKQYAGAKLRRQAETAFDSKDFSPHVIDWLNSIFDEDTVVRNYLFTRLQIEQRFRIRSSLPVINIDFKTIGKQNIGLIAVDNRRIEIDLNISLQKDAVTGQSKLISKEWNDFEVKSPKMVYHADRRTRVFILLAYSKYAFEQLPPTLQSDKPKVEDVLKP